MAITPQLAAMVIGGAVIAYLIVRFAMGVASRAVAMPLALAAGGVILAANLHPGLGLLAALVVYWVAGRVVAASLKLLGLLVAIAIVAWAVQSGHLATLLR